MKKDLQKIQKLIEDLRIEQYHGIEIESMDVKLHFIEMELFKLMDKLVIIEEEHKLDADILKISGEDSDRYHTLYARSTRTRNTRNSRRICV